MAKKAVRDCQEGTQVWPEPPAILEKASSQGRELRNGSMISH
jgi:hypothetical protein